MMTNRFGEGWFRGGRMSLNLINVLWVDEQVQAGAGLGVIHLHLALVETQGADVQGPAGGLLRLVFRLGRKLEGPIVAAVGQTADADPRAAQIDARNAQPLPEQRQRGDAEFHPLETDEIAAFGPFRVAQTQILSSEVRPGHQRAPATLAFLPLPDDAKVALDGEFTSQFGGRPLVEHRLDAVPVEGSDQHQQGHQQQRQCQDRPGQDAKTSCHAFLPFIHDNPWEAACSPCLIDP